jgi:hypothetical protein
VHFFRVFFAGTVFVLVVKDQPLSSGFIVYYFNITNLLRTGSFAERLIWMQRTKQNMRLICSTSWNICYLECAGEKSQSAPLAAGEPEKLRRLKGLPSFIGAAVVVVISPCAATAIFSYTSCCFWQMPV